MGVKMVLLKCLIGFSNSKLNQWGLFINFSKDDAQNIRFSVVLIKIPKFQFDSRFVIGKIDTKTCKFL